MPFFQHKDHRLHYVDQGAGDVIVFVHGTPIDSSEYRAVVETLSQRYRCIVGDHLGLSDKPASGNYDAFGHRDRLAALLDHLNIRSFHLVVHDFGGIIGIPLLRHHELNIRSVTIMNSWLWPLVETEPALRKQQWLFSSGILPFLYRYFNISPKLLLKAGWGKKTKLTKERHQYYIDQFPSPSLRSGPIGLLRLLFDFKGAYWDQSDTILKLQKVPRKLSGAMQIS
jgi:pimeloyl-ACP methyl ester carboxylesterase